MSNIYKIFDDLNQEDYLCHKLKPRGMLRCGHCHEYYEPVVDDTDLDNPMVVCKSCYEPCMPYEEE